MKFQVSTGPHNMPSLQIESPTTNERDFVRSVILCQYMDSPKYAVTHKAGAFLQCDYDDYLLVEFWHTRQEDYQPFLDYLNDNFETYNDR